MKNLVYMQFVWLTPSTAACVVPGHVLPYRAADVNTH
jgi:hypothetical protein